jgi:hypothetical protein
MSLDRLRNPSVDANAKLLDVTIFLRSLPARTELTSAQESQISDFFFEDRGLFAIKLDDPVNRQRIQESTNILASRIKDVDNWRKYFAWLSKHVSELEDLQLEAENFALGTEVLYSLASTSTLIEKTNEHGKGLESEFVRGIQEFQDYIAANAIQEPVEPVRVQELRAQRSEALVGTLELRSSITSLSDLVWSRRNMPELSDLPARFPDEDRTERITYAIANETSYDNPLLRQLNQLDEELRGPLKKIDLIKSRRDMTSEPKNRFGFHVLRLIGFPFSEDEKRRLLRFRSDDATADDYDEFVQALLTQQGLKTTDDLLNVYDLYIHSDAARGYEFAGGARTTTELTKKETMENRRLRRLQQLRDLRLAQLRSRKPITIRDYLDIAANSSKEYNDNIAEIEVKERQLDEAIRSGDTISEDDLRQALAELGEQTDALRRRAEQDRLIADARLREFNLTEADVRRQEAEEQAAESFKMANEALDQLIQEHRDDRDRSRSELDPVTSEIQAQEETLRQLYESFAGLQDQLTKDYNQLMKFMLEDLNARKSSLAWFVQLKIDEARLRRMAADDSAKERFEQLRESSESDLRRAERDTLRTTEVVRSQAEMFEASKTRFANKIRDYIAIAEANQKLYERVIDIWSKFGDLYKAQIQSLQDMRARFPMIGARIETFIEQYQREYDEIQSITDEFRHELLKKQPDIEEKSKALETLERAAIEDHEGYSAYARDLLKLEQRERIKDELVQVRVKYDDARYDYKQKLLLEDRKLKAWTEFEQFQLLRYPVWFWKVQQMDLAEYLSFRAQIEERDQAKRQLSALESDPRLSEVSRLDQSIRDAEESYARQKEAFSTQMYLLQREYNRYVIAVDDRLTKFDTGLYKFCQDIIRQYTLSRQQFQDKGLSLLKDLLILSPPTPTGPSTTDDLARAIEYSNSVFLNL